MNDPRILKRPKPGDGEEELFRMQEEFLQSREQPSAKVINLRLSNQKTQCDNEKPSKFRSKFAERRALREQTKLSTSQSAGSIINSDVVEKSADEEVIEKLMDPVQNFPRNPSKIILGNIVEKKLPNFPAMTSTDSPSGFPEVFIVNQKESTTETCSLFHQNLTKPINSTISVPKRTLDSQESSVMIEGPLGAEIHKLNLEKLNSMSTEEILKEKAQLESTLSPDLIKFIKARRNSSLKSENSRKMCSEVLKMEIEDHKPSIVTENMMDTDVALEPPAPASEIAEKAAESGWIHMDDVESVKLEWMKDIEPEKLSELSPEEPYNARFNFEGMLLPFRDENILMDKGLHHHGEEPERPGYSLQELLQLSRSATQQQRCTALNTLANIMEKSRKGWYDKVLEPAPLSALNSRDILLFLRFSLDDTSLAIVTASLQALRAFLYSEADEVCLDRLSGWVYDNGTCVAPNLSPPKNDVNDLNNLKDHALAQLDTVAAAVRSDILLRIRYVLSKMQPPPVGVTAALEILIRLARHSKMTALNIACTPDLLEIIVKNFIPLTTDRLMNLNDLKIAYGVPNVTAIRLCRILIEYAGRPVAERLHNLRIVNSLILYTTSEPGEAGLHLSIEALRLWEALCAEGIAKESISGARLMLGSQLQLLLSNHDLQSASELACEHAAALVRISIREEILRPTIATLLTKWSTQLASLTSPTWSNTKLAGITLRSLNEISGFRTECFRNKKIFEELTLSSNLLSGHTAANRDPSSLPSLGAQVQEGELQPIVSLKSCFPFLSTLVNVFLRHNVFEEFQTILENTHMIRYLTKLSIVEWSMENSWYTRSELFLLTGIIKVALKISLNEFAQRAILRIAIKLISTLPSDATEITKDILHIVLSNQRINAAKLSNEFNFLRLNSVQSTRLQLPTNISAIYEEFIAPGTWAQAAMPKDWLYLPMVAAYSNHKNQIKWNENDTIKIVFLLNLEVMMPELFEGLAPTLRFSRLILIYLCDTVNLNDNVSSLLTNVITDFLGRYHKQLNLTEDIPGVSSFTDLFTAICEAFCANSYGDDGFSMVLLIPIAQRHDVHYRKLLWSEHAGALRYLKISPNKLPIPLEEYLNPPEDDPSLIESYLTALVRGTVREEWSPLMYKIAVHHSALYLRQSTKLAMKMRHKISTLQDATLSKYLLEYDGVY